MLKFIKYALSKMKYSKACHKRMRELVAQAYEKELSFELEKLSGQFQLWREEKITVQELEHAIHKFHSGPAKKLYGRYTDLPPEMILPYALKALQR
jgi:hypothetical protein